MLVRVITCTAIFFIDVGNMFLLLTVQITVGFNILGILFKETGVI